MRFLRTTNVIERKVTLVGKRIRISVLLVLMSVLAILISSVNLRIPLVQNVSAVSVAGGAVGVYWDQAATNSCASISWGTLVPGESVTFVLFLRNEANQSLYYLLSTSQWSPLNASRYIGLKWNYDGSMTNPRSVLRVLLTLSVSRLISGVTNFSFDIVILASPYLFGDVDSDGRVDVMDLAVIARAFSSVPGSVKWNSNADVNGDGAVDV
jgi:hypothetical protein